MTQGSEQQCHRASILHLWPPPVNDCSQDSEAYKVSERPQCSHYQKARSVPFSCCLSQAQPQDPWQPTS